MVRNTIKVYGRIKSTDKNSHRNYQIKKSRDFTELIFNTDTSGDYGFYKNCRHRYRFCSIFEDGTTQSDVFDNIAKPVVNSVLQGYNGTVFAYGQTGSGKTYSMTGSAEYDTRGVIPRTIQHVFECIRNTSNVLYNIYISYLEIYNETGYDLLNPKHRTTYLEDLPRVTILEDARGQTHLRNLGVISVASEREAMCLLFLGDTNRTIAETPMNMYSSRSHCIFTVHVSATTTEDGRVRRSKLHLVDLAGSERIQKSAISGTLLVDAKQINLSLHYLEQVIIALSDEKRAHVPYRNSMMTSVLKDSLGGNCLTAMLATLSVDPKNFEETISTCKFAQRVALVSSEAFINEEEDPEVKISQLKLQLENLKKELILYKDPNVTKFRFELHNTKELTKEEIKECENKVSVYIASPSDIFSLEDDINKIQTYFKIFRKIILSQRKLMNSDKIECKSYADIIKQKDNEISILTHLLSKEKLKVKEAEKNRALLSPPPPFLSSQLPFDPSEPIPSTPPFVSSSEIEDSSGEPIDQASMSEKKAFEIFMANDKNQIELNNCVSALKQKIAAAKNVASKIKMCKNSIVTLKVKLRENINNSPDVAKEVMNKLKSQQDTYRENVILLRNLKAETDHLSHGYQQERLRTFQRFKNWWANENNRSSKQQTKIPPYVENAKLFQPKKSQTPIIFQETVNNYNYQTENNIVTNSDFISLLSNRNQDPFSVDTFPNFYDHEIDDIPISRPVSYNENSIDSFHNQSYGSKYNIQENATNFASANVNQYQSINSYQDHQSYNRSNGRLEFDSNSQVSQKFCPEKVSKQFAKVSQGIKQYPTNQYSYNDTEEPTGYSGNYRRHYSANSEQSYIEYKIPEKVREIKSSPQFQEDSHYFNYFPVENRTATGPKKSNFRSSVHNVEDIPEEISDRISLDRQTSIQRNTSSDYLKNVPLTGDPEVDDEIIAFYRAKQNIINSNSK